MTESEQKFLNRIELYNCSAYHNGWPDFFVINKQGKVFYIEVKDKQDRISECQKTMFEALGNHGITVLVFWTPYPDILIPWKAFYKRTTGDARQKVGPLMKGFRISVLLK